MLFLAKGKMSEHLVLLSFDAMFCFGAAARRDMIRSGAAQARFGFSSKSSGLQMQNKWDDLADVSICKKEY